MTTQHRLIEILRDGLPRCRRELASDTGLSVSAVDSAIVRMERAGRVVAVAGHARVPMNNKAARRYTLTEVAPC